ncbi:hypothetical protein AAZX31_06G290900 [Glycine max]
MPNNVDGSPPFPHGYRVKIRMDTPSGIKDSIPAWIKFAVQALGEIPYRGIYYDPLEENSCVAPLIEDLEYVFEKVSMRKTRQNLLHVSNFGSYMYISHD